MTSPRVVTTSFLRFIAVIALFSSIAAASVHAQETEDSKIFISGFNAYQQKNYSVSIEKMSEVLQKHPDTPLRDMALFWLSRSYQKTGNQHEAARYLSQFSKEYPDNPLRNTVGEEMLSLAARYDRGERLAGAPATTVAAAPMLMAKSESSSPVPQIISSKPAPPPPPPTLSEKAAQEIYTRDKAVQQTAAVVLREETPISAVIEQKAAPVAAKQIPAPEQTPKEISSDDAIMQQVLASVKTDRVAKANRVEKQPVAPVTAVAPAKKASPPPVEEKQIVQLPLSADESRKMQVAAENAERDRVVQQLAAVMGAEKTVPAQETTAVLTTSEQKKSPAAPHTSPATARDSTLATTPTEAARTRESESHEHAMQQIAASIAAERSGQHAAIARTAPRQPDQPPARQIAQKAAPAGYAETALRKADEEHRAAERLSAEERRRAALIAEENRLAQMRLSETKTGTPKSALREKAIAEYKNVVEKFPGTTAAATAASKLRALGVAVAYAPPKASEVPLADNAQVVRFEVEQFAGIDFNLLSRQESSPVGRQVLIPFEVINRGNGIDSFALGSGFPSDFKLYFAAANTPGIALTTTPDLAPGETFKGVIGLEIPSAKIDGLHISYPVRAASRLQAEASQSRELKLQASAPLLRAIIRTDKQRVLPGEQVVYRISILNVGSTYAQDVSVRLAYSQQLEPVENSVTGFHHESGSNLRIDGIQVNTGQNRELTVAFRVKENSLAGQELSVRAELVNNPLKTAISFVSNTAVVDAQRGITVRSGEARKVAIPGQKLTTPYVITNTGNIKERFFISSTVSGAAEALVFNDLNRDGLRQSNEPVITEIGPLAPREEAGVVMEIATSPAAADGSKGEARINFVSEGDAKRSSSATLLFDYSRPILKMSMSALNGRLKPGSIASFDLTVVNNGSNIARGVELKSSWPDQLELVASNPAATSVKNGTITWNFKEMGAGEKRVIQVTCRLKSGTGVGTGIQLRNMLAYEDQLGNRY